MSILFVNDVHLADKPPLGRVEGYTDQIMIKLEECRGLVGPEDVTVWTGDIFHCKRPTFVSHALVQRLIYLLRGWPGRKLAILGNHDLGPAGVESVSRQPIGVLFRAGVLELLDQDTEVAVDGARALLSPAHYKDEATPEYFAFTDKRPKGAKWVIKVAHGMIFPPSSAPPYGSSIDAGDIDTSGIDYFFNGHVHDDHGDYKVGDCTFVNYGSLSRVARTSGNQRDVHVALLRGDGTVEKVRLESALPANEIFLAVEGEGAGAVEDDDLKAYARELVYALQRGSSASIEDLLVEMAEGVSEPVKARVQRYLVEAGL